VSVPEALVGLKSEISIALYVSASVAPPKKNGLIFSSSPEALSVTYSITKPLLPDTVDEKPVLPIMAMSLAVEDKPLTNSPVPPAPALNLAA
jgi:hypothetical protein